MKESDTPVPVRMMIDMMKFMKDIYLMNIHSMMILQDHSMQILNTIFEQHLETQREANRVVKDLAGNFKKAFEDFQSRTEENFDNLCDSLND